MFLPFLTFLRTFLKVDFYFKDLTFHPAYLTLPLALPIVLVGACVASPSHVSIYRAVQNPVVFFVVSTNSFISIVFFKRFLFEPLFFSKPFSIKFASGQKAYLDPFYLPFLSFGTS